jgi:hypothetical protein
MADVGIVQRVIRFLLVRFLMLVMCAVYILVFHFTNSSECILLDQYYLLRLFNFENQMSDKRPSIAV